VQEDRVAAWHGDQRSILLAIQKQPGTNTLAVVERIRALLPEFQRTLPAGIDMTVQYDRLERASARPSAGRREGRTSGSIPSRRSSCAGPIPERWRASGVEYAPAQRTTSLALDVDRARVLVDVADAARARAVEQYAIDHRVCDQGEVRPPAGDPDVRDERSEPHFVTDRLCGQGPTVPTLAVPGVQVGRLA
jgi:hypothetical protein